jgi:chromosomal replication initiator protein
VGLGKTHLLYAIGNAYIRQNPNKNVRYVPTDEFIREIYDALGQGGGVVEKIKNKFRSYDLILMDDIQFLAKKEKMNEIFFNIFNSNVDEGKIIVMTSDKPPVFLEHFEQRMKSRFASGLTIKISPPNLLSMTSILEQKIKDAGSGFIFSTEAVQYIVRRNARDIRQLEGYLHRILFYVVNNLPPNAIVTPNIIQQYIERESEDS